MKKIASKQQIPDDSMHKRITSAASRRVLRLRRKHGTAKLVKSRRLATAGSPPLRINGEPAA
jgi:hypothetical protein